MVKAEEVAMGKVKGDAKVNPYALVKPLDPIMVTKEITEQIPTGDKDEEGYNKYETKTETKEVESERCV